MTLRSAPWRALFVTAALLGASAPAQAETTLFAPAFDPPLDAPAPLVDAVEMALAPGAAVRCASRELIEGQDAPRPAQSLAVFAVEDSAEGLVLRITEPEFGLFEFAFLIGADGAVSALPVRTMNAEAELAAPLAAELALIAPELLLHGKSWSQNDLISAAPETLAATMVRLINAVGGASATPVVDGGAFVVGISDSDGRAHLIIENDLSMVTPAEGLVLRVAGREAYDIETGLRIYANNVIDITAAPRGRRPVSFVIRQEIVCAFPENNG